jgi:hypothetical protein
VSVDDCRWVWDKWGSRLYPSEMFWERGIKLSRDVVEEECWYVCDVCSGFVITRSAVGRSVRKEVCRIDCFAVENISVIE